MNALKKNTKLMHNKKNMKVVIKDSHIHYINGLNYDVVDSNGAEWFIKHSDIGTTWKIVK